MVVPHNKINCCSGKRCTSPSWTKIREVVEYSLTNGRSIMGRLFDPHAFESIPIVLVDMHWSYLQRVPSASFEFGSSSCHTIAKQFLRADEAKLFG